jgi:hypothetical protein
MTMQPLAALPVDADLWWIVYLRGALVGRGEPYAQGVHFDRRVPNARKDRMVIVRRDGGNVSGAFDRPRIALDVWAKSEQDATNLANLMVALAFDAPGTNGCVRVQHLSGPNDVADPSGQPRRLSLIEATHRSAVLT